LENSIIKELFTGIKKFSNLVDVTKDEYLFTESAPLDYIYFIENGEIGLRKFNGENEVEFMLQNKGDIVGVDVIFSDSESGYAAIAKQDSSLYKTSVEDFKKIISQQKATSIELMKYICALISKIETKNKIY